jgi:hypothetical protein
MSPAECTCWRAASNGKDLGIICLDDGCPEHGGWQEPVKPIPVEERPIPVWMRPDWETR